MYDRVQVHRVQLLEISLITYKYFNKIRHCNLYAFISICIHCFHSDLIRPAGTGLLLSHILLFLGIEEVE
jgi:hypothetical protein